MNRFSKFAYASYGIIRRIIRASGLLAPVRRLAGPVTGRLLFKLSSGSSGVSQLRGHRMYLASSAGYPPVDMGMDRYEPRTTELLEETIKPGMVVIDVGAHVGYYTLLAARRVGPTGTVYAFEPDQGNYGLLLQNIELNGYQNVVATRMAVSNQVGQSDLYLTALDSGRNSMYHSGLPERGTVIVETTTLDTFLESKGRPRVDLIKIDVEGAEATVLDGMSRLIKNSSNLKLVIEFNPAVLGSAGVVPMEFLNRLASPGWKLSLIDDAEGLRALVPDEFSLLVDRLSASETSVNLFCVLE